MPFAPLFRTTAAVLLLAAAGVPAAIQAQPAASTEPPGVATAEARYGLSFEPVDFDPPAVTTATLDNGVSLHSLHEPGVPLVTVLVRIGAGSVRDPGDKVGAASMTAQVIRNGGTRERSGDEIDRALESRGARLSVESDREETWFRLNVLREDLEWGMGLLAEILDTPALPAAKLDEERGRALVELQQRLDVPMEVASALYPQLAYGKGNPWGWTATDESLTALTVDDLRAFYDRWYTRDNLMLGIAGSVETDRAQSLARQFFGDDDFLHTSDADAPPLPDVHDIEQTRIYLVPRDVTQHVLYVGHEGVDRFDEDKFPLKLFNRVLSGGFASRLFQEVRSKRGLAYAVFGRMGEGTVKGLYYNVALTKAESSGQTLDLLMQINENLQQEPPNAEEMSLARQSAVNSFVFLFETAEQVVRQQMTLDAYDYPEDYLATYTDQLKAVTAEQVRAAAADNVHLGRSVILIVGQVDDTLRDRLEQMGEVTVIDEQSLRAEWL